jgi:hypothetical protein
LSGKKQFFFLFFFLLFSSFLGFVEDACVCGSASSYNFVELQTLSFVAISGGFHHQAT